MSTAQIADRALKSFRDWVKSVDDGAVGYEHDGQDYLSDFIRGWLLSGNGIVACNGDFQTYLVSVIVIIERWHRSTLDLGESTSATGSPKRVVSKLMLDNPDAYDHYDSILDPDQFAQFKFDTLHPDISV